MSMFECCTSKDRDEQEDLIRKGSKPEVKPGGDSKLKKNTNDETKTSSEAQESQANIGAEKDTGSNGGDKLRPEKQNGTENVTGLKAEAKEAETVKVGAKVEGCTVTELHDNIRCDTDGFQEALQVARRLLSVGSTAATSQITQIAEHLVFDPAALEKVIEPPQKSSEAHEESGTSDTKRMTLNVEPKAAEVRLDWASKQGFQMRRVGDKTATSADVGADVFAAKHHTEDLIMIILGIGSSFAFEYTFPVEAALMPESSPQSSSSPSKSKMSRGICACRKREKLS